MATVTTQAWVDYYNKLSALDEEATKKVADFITSIRGFSYNNPNDMRRLVNYAYLVSNTYGEAAAAWACEMYDACGLASGLLLEPAMPADPPEYGEVAKTVYGVAKNTGSAAILAQSVGLLVKKTAQKTTIDNAKRDDAQIAFICHGDTCAYCIALSSKGWQDANNSDLEKDGEPSHLHGNCDCTYGVKFNDSLRYPFYKPEKYAKMYYGADTGDEPATAKNRINAMRREFYKKNKDKINDQKKIAYERRKELNSSKAEEYNIWF